MLRLRHTGVPAKCIHVPLVRYVTESRFIKFFERIISQFLLHQVIGKYSDGEAWLGMTGSAKGEWPVAYHGTKDFAVKPILEQRLQPGQSQAYGYICGPNKNERCIYSTPD